MLNIPSAYDQAVTRLLDGLRPPDVASGVPVITDDDDLKAFLWDTFRVRLPDVACCPGHCSPFQAFADAYFARAPITVWKASRGFGGKSWTLALLALTEAITLRADVAVLGGSGQQAERVLEAMGKFWNQPTAPRQFLASEPGKKETRFVDGNVVTALMASSTSVRGPHPQRLRLDECLAGGTRIATPLGWRNIEVLRPGDNLYCWHEGRVVVGTIKVAWRRGVRETVHVRFSDGAQFIATPEHPVLSTAGWWTPVAEATTAQAVSFVRRDSDSGRSPGPPAQGRLYGLLSRARDAGRAACLSVLRRTEEHGLRDVPAVLPRATPTCGADMPGLSGHAPTEGRSLPTLPSAVDERSRPQPDGGRTGHGLGQNPKQSGTASPRAAVGLEPDLRAAGSHWALGCRSTSTLAADCYRSPRRVLARRGEGPRAGRQADDGPPGARLSGTDSADGSDALLVENLALTHVASVERGPSVPVFDLATTYGTFVAEGIVVHNCDEMDLQIFDAAMGQTMARSGIPAQTVCSSTHQYADGMMTEVLKRAKDKGWPVMEWCWRETLEPHGWNPIAEINRKRLEVTEAMWLAEYDLQEPISGTRAIVTEAVDRMFRVELGVFPGTPGKPIQIEGPVRGGRYVHGADWAKKEDWTVVTTFRVDCRPMKLVCWERINRRPWPMMTGLLDDRLDEYGGQAAHDATGIGDVIADHLKRPAMPVIMVGRDRADLLSEYIAAIERDEIEAPRIEAMYGEHKFATVEDVFGAGHEVHLPDTIASGALAYRATRSTSIVAVTRPGDPARASVGPSDTRRKQREEETARYLILEQLVKQFGAEAVTRVQRLKDPTFELPPELRNGR